MYMYCCVYIVSACALNICKDWFGAFQIPTIIIISINSYHSVESVKKYSHPLKDTSNFRVILSQITGLHKAYL